MRIPTCAIYAHCINYPSIRNIALVSSTISRRRLLAALVVVPGLLQSFHLAFLLVLAHSCLTVFLQVGRIISSQVFILGCSKCQDIRVSSGILEQYNSLFKQTLPPSKGRSIQQGMSTSHESHSKCWLKPLLPCSDLRVSASLRPSTCSCAGFTYIPLLAHEYPRAG